VNPEGEEIALLVENLASSAGWPFPPALLPRGSRKSLERPNLRQLRHAEQRLQVDVPFLLWLCAQVCADRGPPFRASRFEHPLSQRLECSGVDRVKTAAGALDDVPGGGFVGG
jgi:hypothetical protein